MRPAIRLVALDLDGTLVSPGEYIPQATIDALKRAALSGILITTASGRDVEQQLPLLERYELGARCGLPHFLLTNEAHLYLAEGGAYEPWAEHNSPMILAWQRLLPAAIAITQQLVSRLQREGFEVKRASSDEFAGRRCLIDFTIVGALGAKRAQSLLTLAAAEQSNELRPNCVQGGSDRYHLQLTPAGGGKGVTLLALARKLGLEPREILAVGDSGNDRDLLAPERGFRTATVANADEDIKDLVRRGDGYLSGMSRGDGVRDILGHFGLS